MVLNTRVRPTLSFEVEEELSNSTAVRKQVPSQLCSLHQKKNEGQKKIFQEQNMAQVIENSFIFTKAPKKISRES